MRLPPKLWHLLHSRAFRRFLIASPFLLALSITTFYTTINLWGSAKLNQARQSLHNQGHPTTLKELLARNPAPEVDFYQSPPFLNDLNLDAHATLVRLGYTETALEEWQPNPLTGRHTSAHRLTDGSIADESAAAQKVLADLATLSPNADDWHAALKQSKGIGHSISASIIATPELSKDHALKFFATRARMHAKAGNAEHALDDLSFLTKWCHLQDQAPTTVMAVLIRMATASITAVSAWDIAAQPAVNEEQLAALQSTLAAIEIKSAAVDAYQVEQTWIIDHSDTLFNSATAVAWSDLEWNFDWQDPGDWGENLIGISRQFLPAGFAKADVADLLLTIDRRFLHLPDGTPRRSWTRTDADRMQSIEDAMPEYNTFGKDPVMDLKWNFHGLAASIINRNLSINATIRLAILTVASQRHHRAHGHFPTTIADLIPTYLDATLIDPMSDQPIRLDPQPDGSLHLTAPGDQTRKPITWICPPNK